MNRSECKIQRIQRDDELQMAFKQGNWKIGKAFMNI